VSGKLIGTVRKLPRILLAAVMALTLLLPPTTLPAAAVSGSGDRTLTFHHTHTGLTQSFTFKRNGQYDKSVLKKMNVFLADWRTKEPTNMDPALFDLLWQIYNAVDGSQPINIVSSYRSPKTNKMLRSKSSGVAENSQHMKGKAMDIFIPGVNLSKLREAAMKFQVGGVGYYPTSGSPFVHVDTGSVRAWPRMTRAQLKKVFPDGKTLHLPTDGKPLSNDGRAYAQAQWTKCHAVPCNGAVTFETDPGIMIADATGDVAPIPGADAAPIPLMKPADLYGDAEVLVASADIEADPAQRVVSTFEVAAPIPIARPSELEVAAAGDYSEWEKVGAPVPAVKSERIQLATRSPLGGEDGQTALAALTAIDPMPKPRVLMTPKGDEMVTAYVPTNQDPGAELALKMIIEREGSIVPELPAKTLDRLEVPDEIRTASFGKGDQFTGIFDETFNALDDASTSQPIKSALADLVQSRLPNGSIAERDIELVAPEIDHVNETLVQPVVMTDGFWAVLSEAEGYLDKGTELGPLTGRIDFIPDNAAIPQYDRFVTGTPQLVAGL
jgi:uncharacterized protein YcbK (DUF882 family)